MDLPPPAGEAPGKSNRTLLIVAGFVFLLCCGCVIVAVVGYLSFVTIRSMETQELPVEDFPPAVTEETATPSADENFPFDSPGSDGDVGDPPEGGLGNEILRRDTWQSVSFVAMGQGCDTPSAEDSTIEVMQEPDAAGVWLEKWTVVCESGDSYAFEVEYVLDETGATFNIRSLP